MDGSDYAAFRHRSARQKYAQIADAAEKLEHLLGSLDADERGIFDRACASRQTPNGFDASEHLISAHMIRADFSVAVETFEFLALAYEEGDA